VFAKDLAWSTVRIGISWDFNKLLRRTRLARFLSTLTTNVARRIYCPCARDIFNGASDITTTNFSFKGGKVVLFCYIVTKPFQTKSHLTSNQITVVNNDFKNSAIYFILLLETIYTIFIDAPYKE
ncbi:unnamed protein product, partial [Heterotrigona itama]